MVREEAAQQQALEERVHPASYLDSSGYFDMAALSAVKDAVAEAVRELANEKRSSSRSPSRSPHLSPHLSPHGSPRLSQGQDYLQVRRWGRELQFRSLQKLSQLQFL